MKRSDEQAVALLAEALMLEPQAIDADTALGLSREWDSLAHMRLMLALEQQLGRQLGPQEIVGIGCLADVVALINTTG